MRNCTHLLIIARRRSRVPVSGCFPAADEEAFMNRHIVHLCRFAHRAEVRR